MMKEGSDFWDKRYLEGRIGWDIGYASPPLMRYCEGLDFNIKILIPGAGNAYEWIALKEAGYLNVYVVDISSKPINALKDRYPQWAKELIHEDFFDHQGSYDIILEQTFFCALPPPCRNAYVLKMSELLQPSGTVAGLLFNRSFKEDGPPFGGSAEEYESLFKKEFSDFNLSPCSHSIPERMGSEVFFEARLA